MLALPLGAEAAQGGSHVGHGCPYAGLLVHVGRREQEIEAENTQTQIKSNWPTTRKAGGLAFCTRHSVFCLQD